MKTLFITISTLILSLSILQAQTDTMYVMKAGVVINKQSIKPSDVDSIIFYNPIPASVTDLDGNVYHTITIGTQTWMVENLKTTKFRNGESITNIIDNTSWGATSFASYCNYNNDAAQVAKFGRLYNWYAVTDTRKIAPEGWHVASDAEWTALENYLITNGYNYDGSNISNKIAKALASSTDWNTSTAIGAIGNNLTENNTSGFAAVPAGYRNTVGAYDNVGFDGYWWCSTESTEATARFRYLFHFSYNLYNYHYSKNYGFSVRCVRD